MGKVNLTIDDALEQRLREEAAKRFGYKRGNLIQAVEEALRDWVNKK